MKSVMAHCFRMGCWALCQWPLDDIGAVRPLGQPALVAFNRVVERHRLAMSIKNVVESHGLPMSLNCALEPNRGGFLAARPDDTAGCETSQLMWKSSWFD
jgi:hypothetical protein